MKFGKNITCILAISILLVIIFANGIVYTIMSTSINQENKTQYQSGPSQLFDNNPPNASYNPHPANGSINVDLTSQLGWSCEDPDGDPLTYDIYFGEISPPPKIVSNQSNNTYDPEILHFNTKYYWQIVAWDNHSACNASPIWEFTTKQNNPPITPDLSGNPRWWCTESDYTLKMGTNDPESHDIEYQVDWGDGHIEWFGPYSSGEMVSPTHRYHAFANYNIKVKVRDTYGAESNWSDVLVVMVSEPELQKMIIVSFTPDFRECGNYYWFWNEFGGYMQFTPPEIRLLEPGFQIVLSKDYKLGVKIDMDPYYLFIGFFDAMIIEP